MVSQKIINMSKSKVIDGHYKDLYLNSNNFDLSSYIEKSLKGTKKSNFLDNKSNFLFTLLYLFKTHEKQGRPSSFSEPFFTFLILFVRIEGSFMKDLLGAVLVHVLFAVLLGWFLINLVS